MRHEPEYIEGPEAFTRFTATMKHILAVPHAEVQQRIEQHRKEAALNPRKRGPKSKEKTSASLSPREV
jgi:hypothetical protein